MKIKLILIVFLFVSVFSGCEKKEIPVYEIEAIPVENEEQFIKITDNIIIDNAVVVHDSIFNYNMYEKFLRYLASSDHFLIVPLRDFKNTTSKDKVVISLRHDVDNDIEPAVKFAYREHKYGIKTTYFILHSSKYYGETGDNYFKRDSNLIHYLKKIQNSYGHEIGFHNDLVTLQIVFNVNSKEFLKNELEWLRKNNIPIWGTTYHGSEYCYIYHYLNAYFWKEYWAGDNTFYNFENVLKDGKLLYFEKDYLANYKLIYEGGLLNEDYFFADCNFVNGKRWNLGMVNLDTIKHGKKVIILLHPTHWR